MSSISGDDESVVQSSNPRRLDTPIKTVLYNFRRGTRHKPCQPTNMADLSIPQIAECITENSDGMISGVMDVQDFGRKDEIVDNSNRYNSQQIKNIMTQPILNLSAQR